MHFALVQNAFSSRAKVFVCSTINSLVIYLEGGLETLEKEEKLWEKVSLKLHFT